MRIELTAVIKYKRGKWSEAERTAMRDHIKGFQEESNLGDAELLEVLMCKGRYDKRSAYPHFWAELCEYNSLLVTLTDSCQGPWPPRQVRCPRCSAHVRPPRPQGCLDTSRRHCTAGVS